MNNTNRLNFNNSFAAAINSLRQLDFFMAAGIAMLVVFGLLALYSLDGGVVGLGSKVFKQAGWIAISSFAFIVFSMMDYNQLRKSASFLFLFALGFLAAVLIIGQTTHGTTGWIRFGSLGFQPVELVKIILIIVLAKFLSRTDFSAARSVIMSFVFTAILFGLVMLQPDLGSGILFMFVWFGLIIFRGIPWRWVAILLVLAAILGAAGWTVLEPYQKDRVLSFLDPFRDSSSSSYQAVQSIVAVGSGKILGRGLGSGSQSQLHFLPEASTDFVFAAIAEEFGFLGIALFFAALFVIFYRLYIAAKTSRDDFGYLVISGFFVLIACETIINSAMNVGLFPIMGIPLPLVSYGGSSLLSTFIGLGIVQSIYRQRKALKLA